jgi:hypothetical protein
MLSLLIDQNVPRDTRNEAINVATGLRSFLQPITCSERELPRYNYINREVPTILAASRPEGPAEAARSQRC